MADVVVIDNLMCYLQSAKNSFTNERIVKCVIGFFSPELIVQSKEAFFRRFNQKMIRRKACDSHPNPADADIDDIISLFEKIDADDKLELPTYASVGVGTMPSSDFDSIAGVLCSLRDEISSLRFELNEVRNEREKDIKVLEQSDNIMHELSEIKTLCRAEKVPVKEDSYVLEKTSGLPSNAFTLKGSYKDVLSRSDGPFNGTVLRKSSKVGNDKLNKDVSTRELPNKPKNKNKQGTKVVNRHDKTSFTVSKQVISMYIGRCSNGTTKESLKDFCETQNIKVLEVDELANVNKWNKSFRVCFEAVHRDTVFNESFWPEGIIFRRYFYPRNKQTKESI